MCITIDTHVHRQSAWVHAQARQRSPSNDGFYLLAQQSPATQVPRFVRGSSSSATNRTDPPGSWWVLFYTVQGAPTENAHPTIVRTKVAPDGRGGSGRPIFTAQPVDAAEFPQVVGDQYGAQCQCMSGDHQIQRANRGAFCVESVSSLCVFLRDG
jgi:hypothetical protein